MSISRIINQAYVNSYNTNKVMQIDKARAVKSTDRIEISSLGKSLKDYSLNGEIDNAKKVAELKMKVQSGTYNVNAKLTAESMINSIKEGNTLDE